MAQRRTPKDDASVKQNMQAYIQNAELELPSAYLLKVSEIRVLYGIIEDGDIWNAIILAYKYGAAKCLRMVRRHGVGKDD